MNDIVTMHLVIISFKILLVCIDKGTLQYKSSTCVLLKENVNRFQGRDKKTV